MADNLSGLSMAQKRQLLARLLNERATSSGPARLPCSSGQQRLWLDHHFLNGCDGYAVSIVWRLRGVADVPRWCASLYALLQRHESLRSVFYEADEQIWQRVQTATPPPLVQVDLRLLPPSAQQTALAALHEKARSQPFDLAQGPLLRAWLVQLGPTFELIIVLHHIAFDGWSLGRLNAELAAHYQAGGKATRLPPLPAQYQDYARWQREQTVPAERLAYWQAQLRSYEPLALPVEPAQASAPPGRGARCRVHLPAALTAALQTLGRSQGATLFMLLLAAWKVLLYRYGCGRQITVGVPFAQRERREYEALIGFFVNNLVLMTTVDERQRFTEFLAQVRTTVTTAFEQQPMPFERLVETLNPPREPGRIPWLQVIFALQQAPQQPDFKQADLALLDIQCDMGVHADLELYLWPARAGLDGVCMYAGERFTAASIQQLLAHYEQLLQSLVARPEQAIAHLELLRESDQRQQLQDWNATVCPYPKQSLASLFEQIVANYGAYPAVLEPSRTLDFATLNQQANRLAHYIDSQYTIAAEDIIALQGERSSCWIAALLAIIKLGAAYVPLDPAYPPARRQAMLADARPVLLLDCDGTLDASAGCPLLSLAGLDLTGQATSNPARTISAQALAYINYTSGSSGTPKGIAIPQSAVVRLVRNSNYIDLQPGDRIAHLSNTAFDATTFELWGGLLNGASIAIISRAAVLEPARFSAALRDYQVNSLFVTTALFNMLVASDPGLFANCRDVLFGGEAGDVQTVRRMLEQGAGPKRLLNVYGPTESTTFASFYPISTAAKRPRIPIGQPLANTYLYILDKHLQLLPVGAVGEIVIGGAGLARGYLGQAALSAANFVPDPYSPQPGARMYRSGDLGRQLPDGNIEYLGRMDRQLKIRGFRVEPAEIERTLMAMPAVRQAVVLTDWTQNQPRLHAYCTVHGVPDTAPLRHWLRQQLPAYMQPASLTIVSAMPLTPNGKLDHAALPRPAQDSVAEGMATPLEQVVADLFAELLAVDQVQRGDNFFALGGHSLQLTRLASMISDRFGIRLALADLFGHAEVAALAARIAAARKTAAAPAVAVVPSRSVQCAKASYAQRRLWLLDRLGICGHAYHSPVNLRLRGTLNRRALRRALQRIAERHSVLHTVFEERQGEPWQLVQPVPVLVLPWHDLSHLPEPQRSAELHRLINSENRRRFDLSRDVLWRTRLIRLGAEEQVLLVTFHHIAFDGWSMAVFLHELSQYYNAYCQQEEPADPLPLLSVQYIDFARWQRQRFESGALHRQIDYWREALKDLTPLALPTDRLRPKVETFRAGQQAFSLEAAVSTAASKLARQHNISLFTVLLAAFQVLLHRYSKQSCIAVGVPIANRTHSDIEGLLGFFVNSLIINVNFSGQPSFAEVLKRVRRRLLGAYEHQDLPFEQLVEQLAPRRSLSQNPLFQVIFALQQQEALAPRLAFQGLQAERLEAVAATVRFDLEFHLWETEAGIRGCIFFNRDLFDAATVARMAEHYRAVLAAALANLNIAITSLPLISAAELAQLDHWSAGHDRR